MPAVWVPWSRAGQLSHSNNRLITSLFQAYYMDIRCLLVSLVAAEAPSMSLPQLRQWAQLNGLSTWPEHLLTVVRASGEGGEGGEGVGQRFTGLWRG